MGQPDDELARDAVSIYAYRLHALTASAKLVWRPDVRSLRPIQKRVLGGEETRLLLRIVERDTLLKVLAG
jgi:hypothetical protein